MTAFGVDVVELARAATMLRRSGDLVLDRVATPTEAVWIGRDSGRLAVVLAAKEAAIKAIGGRPVGFRWWDAALGLDPRGPQLPAEISSLLGTFARQAGLREVQQFGLRLTGACASAILPELGRPPGPGFGSAPAGAACSGSVDGHVLVAAAFWRPVLSPPGPRAELNRDSATGSRWPD